MRKVKIGNHEIEIYDDIQSLPVVRFHKYNKFLIIDAGIGSDLSDFDSHIERIVRFIKANPDLAIKEIENLRQNFYFIQSELSPKHYAFASLVKSIDGVDIVDISDETLRMITKAFNASTEKELTSLLEEVKKKIDRELSLYFPNIFEDSSSKEYFDKVKKRMLLILDEIIEGVEKEKEIEDLTTALVTFAKPSKFQGKESIEIEYDKNFEYLCLTLSQQMHIDPKKFTVIEYYSAFEHLKNSTPKKSKKI